MALLWHKQHGTTRYEVRSAGNARRLYTNGVFHSQYNPRQPVTGSVWDLLMIPAFFAPQKLRRVLVLGVGGGAVIRQLNHFLQPKQIVGVEIDPIHLEVAERYFDVAAENVVLHQADALQWCETYQGPRFDMVIDDLFGEQGGEAQRVVAAESRWFRRLGRLLSPQGVLVFNHGSRRELRSSAWHTEPRIHNRYPSAFELTSSRFENAVAVYLRRPAEAGEMKSRLEATPLLDMRRRSCRLEYRLRKL